MTEPGTAGELLHRFADAIDRQDWQGLGSVLAPEFRACYAHTGEEFDRDDFIALNRDYPGSWSFTTMDLVDAGDRAVLRARVASAPSADQRTSDRGESTYQVATFARAERGLITQIDELWTDELSAGDVPAGTRPGAKQ